MYHTVLREICHCDFHFESYVLTLLEIVYVVTFLVDNFAKLQYIFETQAK